MKSSIIALGSLLLVMACGPNKKSEDNSVAMAGQLGQLQWLAGNWVRTNDASGEITYENWERDSANAVYLGEGFVIKVTTSIFEPDTTFNESIRILAVNDTLNYEVSGVNETPTLFKFIAQTDTSFVCVNEQNEFPKRIAYTFSKGKIGVVISDDNMEIPYAFRRN